jgi:hypothetical protein
MEKIFECEKCNFATNAKQAYEKHLLTEKHKTGKRKTRTDKIRKDKCEECDYTSQSYASMERHVLNKHASIKERKEKFKYYCECCDFGTFRQEQYEKHISLLSHSRMMKKE